MPTKLPPVPKRTSYEDIKEGDLVMALFSDRIFSDSDPDANTRESVDDAAIKHGKHNQASHGRRTARKRAYGAAYSQARAGGATPQEAREKAKEAGLNRQAERDARLGRLREASERRKNAPAAPAPAAAQGNPVLQKQLDDVKQRRSSTEAEIEQSRSKLKQLEQDKKFDEYNREDSRLRTLTERRNSLVREERDVSGMLQDDIRTSRQVPATPAPAAPQRNPVLQKQLDDVKQRRTNTEAEIEQSRSKLRQLEQDKKFDEYNREDSRLRTLTERRNSLVREERDVSGMIQDDIGTSRQVPALQSIARKRKGATKDALLIELDLLELE